MKNRPVEWIMSRLPPIFSPSRYSKSTYEVKDVDGWELTLVLGMDISRFGTRLPSGYDDVELFYNKSQPGIYEHHGFKVSFTDNEELDNMNMVVMQAIIETLKEGAR